MEVLAFCNELVQVSSKYLDSLTPLEILLCILRLSRNNHIIDSTNDKNVFTTSQTMPDGWRRKLDLYLTCNSEHDLLFTISSELSFLQKSEDQEMRLNIEKRNNIFDELRLLISNISHINKANSFMDEEDECIVYSKSKIWTQQQLYYQNQKYNAWDNGDIPYLISSNKAVAVEYMTYINKEVQSYRHMNSSTSHLKVCILEIAAGHGILSYLLAKQAYEQHQSDTNVRFEVIATDFHDTLFKDLLQLPWFHGFCAAGVLDFAVLSTDSICMSPLLYKGNPIGTYDMCFIVGNYAFDSFPIDLIYYNVENDQIFEVNKGLHPQSHDASVPSIESSKYVLKKSSELKYSKYKRLFQLFGSGVYQVPVAGARILQAIRASLDDSCAAVRLLIGDCVVLNDDKRWSPIPAQAMSTDYAAIDFDPPTISEHNHVAFPINPFVIGLLFHEVFSNQSGHNHRFMELYSPFTSAFSVILFSNGHAFDTGKRIKITSSPTLLSFPPYELSTLRTFLSEYRQHHLPFTAAFYRYIICSLGKYDLELFFELQWLILGTIKMESISAQSELILDWVGISRRCIQDHYSINGIRQLGVSRTKIVQFLLALDRVEASSCHHTVIVDTCTQLLDYAFLYTETVTVTKPACKSKSLIVCLSLQEALLYCQLLASSRTNEYQEKITKCFESISSATWLDCVVLQKQCLDYMAQGREVIVVDCDSLRAPKTMKKINRLKKKLNKM